MTTLIHPIAVQKLKEYQQTAENLINHYQENIEKGFLAPSVYADVHEALHNWREYLAAVKLRCYRDEVEDFSASYDKAAERFFELMVPMIVEGVNSFEYANDEH